MLCCAVLQASNCWDVFPCDVVANVILAAAAALGNGLASECHVSLTRIIPEPLAASRRASNAGQAVVKAGVEEEQHGSAGPLLIVHCGSSTTYPLTIMESWNWGVEVYGAW